MLRLLMHILRRGVFPCRRASVFNHVKKFVEIRNDSAGIPVHRVAAPDLFHLVGDEIFYFQHMLHQFHMGNIIRM